MGISLFVLGSRALVPSSKFQVPGFWPLGYGSYVPGSELGVLSSRIGTFPVRDGDGSKFKVPGSRLKIMEVKRSLKIGTKADKLEKYDQELSPENPKISFPAWS